ncbi:ribonuclease PH [Bacillus wiedmannii]|uniref:Ribonuclease PH n=1 Tax=Bacillus wiedmannii TaxID=1890302 RepID=A0A2A8CQY0_9BACI|nr:ribonuclease PH [Bacillus wiedmannii]PEL85310.1 ribonuclease PH [Bacillus wiedmannii]PEM29746.1 ribonuclease PH [Bacillus wiedmannii]PEM91237.1 ribonuclease PH [Bacillus wiedmannii]PEO87170.1 ribonuclease PH [Bacillus wiedmannii]
MIIINYYSTLIDKDYQCQYKPHTFCTKTKSTTKRFVLFVVLYFIILLTFVSF